MKLESAGTYIGTIVDAALSLTDGRGEPQAVLTLRTDQKFIESREDIEWYQQNQKLFLDNQPGFTAFPDEEITAYLLLYCFKHQKAITVGEAYKADGTGGTEMLNVKQLHEATGWNSPDFEGLTSLKGQQILFRVENQKYTTKDGQQKEGLRVTWIDNKDASPTRALRQLDPAAIKNAFAGIPITGTKKTVAKPVAKPTVAATVATQSPTVPASAPVATTSATASSPKAPPKRQAKKAEPEPAGVTQASAWEYVNANKGADQSDDDVAKAWLEATTEVYGDTAEADVTPAQWADVQEKTMQKLASLAGLPI